MILKNIFKKLPPFSFAFQIKQTISIITKNTPEFVSKLRIIRKSSQSTFNGNQIHGVLSRFETFDLNNGEICLFENVEEQNQYLTESQKPIIYIMKNQDFQGLMDASKQKYDVLKNLSQCFNHEDIQNDPESFFKKTADFFTQKFAANSISNSDLPKRLLELETYKTNSPLLWFPERKDFVKKFFPKFNQTGKNFMSQVVVTGNAGVGKSHLALMMALLLRSMNDKFTTIYIPNTERFRDSPTDYLSKELIIWFYDLINNSDWLKILVNVYIYNDSNIELLRDVLVECVKEAKNRGKKVVFMQDQMHLMDKDIIFAKPLNSLQELIDFFCLFTTSTDSHLNKMIRKDGNLGAIHYQLNRLELNVPMIKEVLNSEFNLEEYQSDKNILELLFIESGGDFLLLKEFKEFLYLNNLQKFWKTKYDQVFYQFLAGYQKEIIKKHNDWLTENPKTKFEKKEAMAECVHYIDDPEAFLPTNISQSYIDLRYVLIVSKDEKDLIRGVNPVIRKIFLQIHSSPSTFEKFFNAHPNMIHKAGYGIFFENYLKNVLWNSTNKEIILEKKEKIISLNFKHVFFSSFDEEGPNNMKYLEETCNVYDRILLTPKSEKFPLFDFIAIDFENKIVKFLSVKSKPNKEIKEQDDLNFLLNPLKDIKKLTKKLSKTDADSEKNTKKREIEKQQTVIDKLKNYCKTTRKQFGEDFKFKFVTFTDHDFKESIMKVYRGSLIERILKEGLLDGNDQDDDLLEIFSYENMQKHNPGQLGLKLPKENTRRNGLNSKKIAV